MGFYYSSGEPDGDEEGSFREVLAIMLAIARILAVPFAVLIGLTIAIAAIVWLFVIHAALGLGAIGLIAVALVARGVWEAKHPPQLT